MSEYTVTTQYQPEVDETVWMLEISDNGTRQWAHAKRTTGIPNDADAVELLRSLADRLEKGRHPYGTQP